MLTVYEETMKLANETDIITSVIMESQDVLQAKMRKCFQGEKEVILTAIEESIIKTEMDQQICEDGDIATIRKHLLVITKYLKIKYNLKFSIQIKPFFFAI